MKLTSLSWWTSALMSTFMTMVLMYIIKKATANVNIPVVSNIVNEA